MDKELMEESEELLQILKEGGDFMNNRIGSRLRGIAKEKGNLYADSLVVLHSLTHLAGIPTVNPINKIKEYMKNE